MTKENIIGSSPQQSEPKNCFGVDKADSQDKRNICVISTTHQRTVKKGPTLPGDLPDELDHNKYCVVCKKAYQTLDSYRKHLKSVHKMILTPRKPKPNHDITSDPNNASNHCNSCNWPFTRKVGYRVHLKSVHKMILTKQRGTPTIQIFCQMCMIQIIIADHVNAITQVLVLITGISGSYTKWN